MLYLKENIIDFGGMFDGCEHLTKIEGELDTSTGKNFMCMFRDCKILEDIQGLKNCDFSNGEDFNEMFSNCPVIYSWEPLKNWKLLNGKQFTEMFHLCKFSNVDFLSNLSVPKGMIFNRMFSSCPFLRDINGLKDWDVSVLFLFLKCFLNVILWKISMELKIGKPKI